MPSNCGAANSKQHKAQWFIAEDCSLSYLLPQSCWWRRHVSRRVPLKSPTRSKTNIIKEKHLKQKPEINRKASATTATTQPPVIAPTIEALEPTPTTTPMLTINSTEASSLAASANATTHEQQEVKFLVSKNEDTAAATAGQPTEEKPKENNSNESGAITFEDDSADAGEANEETLVAQIPMPATTTTTTTTTESNLPVPCTCGIFMASQIKRGSSEPPQGMPVIMNELDRNFPCNPIGQKQCQTKCLETIVQHLPNSANILCATLNRDCRKERAYLFVKNCHNHWWNTNLAAGREYCCRSGQPYPCPMV